MHKRELTTGPGLKVLAATREQIRTEYGNLRAAFSVYCAQLPDRSSCPTERTFYKWLSGERPITLATWLELVEGLARLRISTILGMASLNIELLAHRPDLQLLAAIGGKPPRLPETMGILAALPRIPPGTSTLEHHRDAVHLDDLRFQSLAVASAEARTLISESIHRILRNPTTFEIGKFYSILGAFCSILSAEGGDIDAANLLANAIQKTSRYSMTPIHQILLFRSAHCFGKLGHYAASRSLCFAACASLRLLGEDRYADEGRLIIGLTYLNSKRNHEAEMHFRALVEDNKCPRSVRTASAGNLFALLARSGRARAALNSWQENQDLILANPARQLFHVHLSLALLLVDSPEDAGQVFLSLLSWDFDEIAPLPLFVGVCEAMCFFHYQRDHDSVLRFVEKASPHLKRISPISKLMSSAIRDFLVLCTSTIVEPTVRLQKDHLVASANRLQTSSSLQPRRGPRN